MSNSEDDLIQRIRRRIPSGVGGELRTGIGDDAAVISPFRGREWVLSTDQFLENVHFRMDVHPPQAIGYKALARATSDLGAMGAKPRLFLLSLALPANRTGPWLDRMLIGMRQAALRFGLRLAGGDTAKSGAVAFNLTVLGDGPSRHAVPRSGARPGDAVFVCGRLGAAQLGLEIVLRNAYRQPRWRRLLRQHYYPDLAIDLGIWIARRRLASAMMDLSDGLSTDLARLCDASGVGARIDSRAIPAVTVPEPWRRRGLDPLALALHGGEDYGLLFTVPKRRASRIPASLGRTRITCIGEIVRGRGVELIDLDGKPKALVAKGWDHFRPAT
jgi:thiamine-monophosphate kinase